jgi:hypothetical protein
MRIRFTLLMSCWDAAAYDRLKDIVAELRAESVIDMFERIISRVWKINVDRFEPSEVGDTNRSLGITATENIRTLVLRESWTAGNPANLGDSVHVTAPNDSLLVQAAGVRLHVMKSAPAIALTEPRWDSDFAWKGESDVRIEAAAANSAGYSPNLAVQGGLFADLLPPASGAARLREAILVWAGGSNNPLTGGWIGLPTLGESPWLAVDNVWWHGTDGITASQRGSGGPADDAFSDRAAPSPVISLKQRPKIAER